MGFSADAPVCNVMAEQEVGPYYVANELLRTDIREGKPGLPLVLRLMVLDSRTCKPLTNAAIDIWHCDALGLYAGFTKMNPMGFGPGGPGGPPPGFDPDHGPPMGPPPGFDPQHPGNRPGPPEGMGAPPPMQTTDELTFLRGIQFTDTHGGVTFATVFPGFYMGRTNHIHFKVREGGRLVTRKAGGGQTYMEGHSAHIGQVFFPEEFSAELMRHEPYSKHQIHRTTQAEDMVYQGQHGEASVSKLRPIDPKRPDAGYRAELIVAVDPSATPAPAGRGGPGGPPMGSGPPRS
jgi:protocatechuate 3,4-dioxygenase beta subunit